MSKLVLEILADSNGLIKGLNAAQSQLDKFMKASDKVGASLGGGVNQALDAFKGLAGGGANAAGVLAGAFAAATTAAFALTVQAGRIAEETEQLAQKTGIAAQSIEGLSVALKRNNLEAGSIALMMKGLSKEMVGVREGSASSINLFQSLGISLETVGKGTGATMRAIADAFKAMPAGADKARIAVELFGKAGLDWIPILNKGSAGLDEAMKKSAEFGLVLTDTQRGGLTVFDDAMDDMESALKGFGMQVGVAFAPAAVILVQAFTGAIVFAKDVFNAFSDAGSKLVIRFSAMAAGLDLLAKNLFSMNAFSKAAWGETMNHVKAIDAWAAAEIHAVDSMRAAEKELGALASAQLNAAQATTAHAASQKVLGEQIVKGTQIQLAQDAAEGKRQERLGQRAQEIFAVQKSLSNQQVQLYEVEEAAAIERYLEEQTAQGRNQEAQGRYIVAQAHAAQQVTGFWGAQLGALVQSNSFSVAQIVATWTSGIAGAIVNGGNFMKAAWQATQIAIIQGALNTGVQLAAQWALRASVELGIMTATEATKLGMKTASNAAIVAGDAAAAGATVSIWAGATATITAFFSSMMGALKTMLIGIMVTVKAVGAFIVKVLVAAAKAMMSNPWTFAFGVIALAGVALLVAALAGAVDLGFKDGGIGNFGSGTQATLHGPEAIIPLNSRGASFMRDAFGGGMGGAQPIIHTHVMLDGRQIALAVSDQQPAAFRTMGVL